MRLLLLGALLLSCAHAPKPAAEVEAAVGSKGCGVYFTVEYSPRDLYACGTREGKFVCIPMSEFLEVYGAMSNPGGTEL